MKDNNSAAGWFYTQSFVGRIVPPSLPAIATRYCPICSREIGRVAETTDAGCPCRREAGA